MPISDRSVLFPTCGPAPEINRVTVTAYLDRHNAIRTCASDQKRQAIREVLGYSRDGEGIETIDTDAVVRFDDDRFHGRSFGLALGIADKLARFTNADRSVAVICATGVVTSRGAIIGVDQFPKKVDLISEQLPAGAQFFYPAENHRGHEKKVAALEERHIKAVGVSTLEDLSWLWTERADDTTEPSTFISRAARDFFIGLGAGMLLPAFAAGLVLLRD